MTTEIERAAIHAEAHQARWSAVDKLLRAFHKQTAFIRRGYLIESSYKVAFLLELLSSFFPVVSFYFIGRLLGDRPSVELARYGSGYFPFVLVGIGLSQFFARALQIFAVSIQRAQTSGVLEAALSSRTGPAALVLYDSTFSFLMASFHLFFVFFLGGSLLGADFGNANLFSVCVVGLVSLLSFMALGIFSAAAILLLKRGDPIQFVFGAGAMFLSGAYFPVSVLPRGLRELSNALPMTHALEALRLALLKGASLNSLSTPLLVLTSMALVLFPTSLWAFTRAVEKGRRDGTLLHY